MISTPDFRLSLALTLALLGSAAYAQEQPTQGGRLTISTSAEPPMLDPTSSTSAEISSIMYDNVLQGLVKIAPSGKIEPSLATRYQVSADAKTYTFVLRQGVKFHDGSAFGPSDVIAALKRAMDPKSGHTHAEYYADMVSVSASGPNTVVIVLSRPNADFLFNLARADSVIMPEGKTDAMKSAPVGTGPFKFVSWQRGSAVTLERNPNYYVKTLPYLDGVTFRFISDPNAQLAALRSGDIDVIGSGLAPENALSLKQDSNFKVIVGSSTNKLTVSMNNARAPFNDIRVRKAVQYAIDKNALLQGVMLGNGTLLGTHRTPNESCYYDLSGQYKPNLQLSRSLLQQAGYTAQKPLKITLTLPSQYVYAVRTGQAVAAQLNRAGIQTEIKLVDFSTWLKQVFQGGDYDMSVIGHAEPNDIGIYANKNYYFHYDNQKFRDKFEKYQRTTNRSAACISMRALQKQLADDAVNVWVQELPYMAALKNRVGGWWNDHPLPSLNVTQTYLRK
ncbi:ABC transporter substrate-binding protein [Deinococcus sp.]|uniref:ABC transporter substrate-binding protein n=1 Tax=Deinococcus sp. TaxID=47478 RepID=UPI0025BBB864|nr:ABC transporter substrate-binding protein [Deinococcus sp.]